MRISALLLGSLLFLGIGCSSDANKKLDDIADRACACKDATCAKKVSEDLQAWAKDAEGKRGDTEAAKKSIGRIMTCISKAKIGGAMDKADKAADEVKDKANEAKEEVKDKAEEAKDKVEEAK